MNKDIVKPRNQGIKTYLQNDDVTLSYLTNLESIWMKILNKPNTNIGFSEQKPPYNQRKESMVMMHDVFK